MEALLAEVNAKAGVEGWRLARRSYSPECSGEEVEEKKREGFQHRPFQGHLPFTLYLGSQGPDGRATNLLGKMHMAKMSGGLPAEAIAPSARGSEWRSGGVPNHLTAAYVNSLFILSGSNVFIHRSFQLLGTPLLAKGEGLGVRLVTRA